MFPKVTAFINTPERQNAWVRDSGLSVYLRHSRRKIANQYIDCVDIANVTARPQGKGTFTSFMEFLEAQPLNLYVENVHSPRLVKWFTRRAGYHQAPRLEEWAPMCFYRVYQSEQFTRLV